MTRIAPTWWRVRTWTRRYRCTRSGRKLHADESSVCPVSTPAAERRRGRSGWLDGGEDHPEGSHIKTDVQTRWRCWSQEPACWGESWGRMWGLKRRWKIPTVRTRSAAATTAAVTAV